MTTSDDSDWKCALNLVNNRFNICGFHTDQIVKMINTTWFNHESFDTYVWLCWSVSLSLCFQDAWTYSNLVWEVPVEVVLCTTMIWTVVGPSALAGIGVLGILMPINGFFAANWIRKLQVG